MKKRSFYIILFVLLVISVSARKSFAQSRVIQMTGLVIAGDSAYGVSGVYIYIPSSGRGTITNHYGFFSIPVLIGDSLVVKALGYRKRHFIVPADAPEDLSVMIALQTDTLLLPAVTITPWATERLFKEAFLSRSQPEQDIINMNENLNDQVMRRMLYSMKADGSENHTYYMQQYVQRQELSRKYFYPNYTQQFLNPFAWAKFINQVKNGGLKSTTPNYNTYEEDE